jgi:hypothetical protein
MHHHVVQGDLEHLKQLLQNGYNPDAESAAGLTPVAAACRGQKFKCVKLLLEVAFSSFLSYRSYTYASYFPQRTSFNVAASAVFFYIKTQLRHW